MSINIGDLVASGKAAELIQLGITAGKAIAAIIEAVRHAGEGKITPEQAHRQITALEDALALNDRAADAALAAKFAGAAAEDAEVERLEATQPNDATGYEPDPSPLK